MASTRHVWTDEKLAELISYRDQGLTQKQAAERMGRPPGTIADVVNRYSYKWPRAADLLWTEERIARLRELIKAGLTGLQIATTIKVSRSAVCGKALRLGLKIGAGRASRPKLPKPRPEPRIRIKSVAPPSPAPRPPKAPPAPVAVDPTPFATITRNQCRWPIQGEGADMICCGSKAVKFPYCEGHRALAFRPQTDRSEKKQESTARYLQRRFG